MDTRKMVVSIHHFNDEQEKAIKAFNEAAEELKRQHVALLHNKITDALVFANGKDVTSADCQFFCIDHAFVSPTRLVGQTSCKWLPKCSIDITADFSNETIAIITDR